MRIEDKRNKETTTFAEVEIGEVFQVIDIDSFGNKYFLQTDDNRFVNIQTGVSHYNDVFYDEYGLDEYDVKVVILNAKLVIE